MKLSYFMPVVLGNEETSKILLLGLIVIIGVLGARFVYYNLIVPWPYRHELQACLATAKASETEEEIMRDACFRKYPHFN